MTSPQAPPVIDVAPLVEGAGDAVCGAAAERIQAACRDRGFFYVTGHGVPAGLLDELAAASAEFFALPVAAKTEIAMARGGTASRVRYILTPSQLTSAGAALSNPARASGPGSEPDAARSAGTKATESGTLIPAPASAWRFQSWVTG